MRIRARGIGEIFETKIGPLKVEDTKLYINPGGPFIRYLLEDGLEALVRSMKDRVSNKFDNLTIIVGGEGSGKSNAAWDIIHSFDPDTDPSEHLYYSAKKLRAHLREDPSPGQIFWLDELYSLASNREWNDPDTKWLVETLIRGRNRGWTFVGCIPRLKDADEYLRNHRITQLLVCEPQDFDHSPYFVRGYAEMQVKLPGGDLTHVGYCRYSEMPQEAADRYEARKNAEQDEMFLAPERESGSSYRMKYEAQTTKLSMAVLMLKDLGIPRVDICQKLGISERTYYKMVQDAKNTDDIKVVDDGDQE